MKTIVVVGVGALGSHLVLLLRNLTAKIKVVDFDKVEAKNVASQFHTNMGRGKNKGVALQAAMSGLFQKKIDAYPVKLTHDNVKQLLQMADVVVDCTDNFSAREVIQKYCKQESIACLHGCLSADGTFARAVWTEHFVPDKEGEEGQATCEDGENLPFHVLASAMIAKIVQKFVTAGKKESWQLTGSSVVRLA